ncbi:MAG: hypothetical protein LBM93_07650 [Oscillospiraceae bacterium]|jgi:hypothetical protein|nr:hypothetical protein [Oscillospiraceae bacterium]
MKIKKTLTLLTAFCLLFSMTACDKSDEKNGSGNAGNVNAGELSSDALENLKPIDILTESVDEIKDIIDKQSNFKVADNFEIIAPEKAALIECNAKYLTTQDFKKYYEEYKEMFNYIFPNNTINEDYLFYIGGSSRIDFDDNGNQIQDYNKVKDKYDDLVAGKEGSVALIYDETWLGGITEWNSQICFEMGSAIGAGYTTINKGKTVKLGGKVKKDIDGKIIESDTYPPLDSYEPAGYLECVGSYLPDSTESFKLLDKEMPINEAVDFFENYINNIPYPPNANLEMCVVGIDVLKVDENTYGYNFLTTARYKDVAFDHSKSGSISYKSDENNYEPLAGNAFMLQSDDIDIIHGYNRSILMENIKRIDKIISIADATKKVSSNLSDEVKFEVQKIEFIYERKMFVTAEGNVDVNNGYPNRLFPVWKFTMVNPNDELNYIAYVDAKDGENFTYHTTKNIETL